MLWLSLESRADSLQTLLGVHQSLELSSWVTLVNVLLVLALLLGSLVIGISDGGVHLSLHVGPLFLFLGDLGLSIVGVIGQLNVFWHKGGGDLLSAIIDEVTSVLAGGLNVSGLSRSMNKGHGGRGRDDGEDCES